MNITFLGGTETVTGSKYLVETGKTRVLVDCGLFQGFKWLRERNWQPLPLDFASLDAVLLTHAHLDHSGYLPVLYHQGFRGPVYTHHATRDLCRILLADSGHLQEEDARFYAKHRIGRHRSPAPLYDRRTAEDCMALFRTVDFGEDVSIADIRFHLQPAGHILGAASIILEAEGRRVGFSGDVGRPDDIFMQPPQPLPELDLLLLESTYGNRRHPDTDPGRSWLMRSTARRRRAGRC
ncbi:MBL fold metallo-hydrolase [Marinobacterium aestuariivivens]|uniref:MBL fold metallo-hydrolase n=1 Tax=Marinobacterium aestuariivivens TaxID=1698799 RepID=A0ABW2A8D3_9GAMM